MRRYGDRALLLDTDRPLDLLPAYAGRPGVVDVVPGAASLLVVCADEAALTDVLRLPAEPVAQHLDVRTVELSVRYDGPDLEDVAARAGLTVDEVVALHSGAAYEVALVGFAPGFAYLAGTDPRLHLPRRDSPREAVPAGSVAVAGGWSGVYPRATPGGWHLLGTTDAVLFDVDRDPPALLQPGTRVRFVPC